MFVQQSVEDVCRSIANIFEIREKEDVGERVYKQGRFGYQSVHLLVNLDKKMYFGKNEEIASAVCEVQVRTILQHAWAEMEHDIQYKGGDVPETLRKRFSALAGLLEIADGEFQRIQSDSEKLHAAVRSNLIDDLTQQGLAERLKDDQGISKSIKQTSKVRDLVNRGKYKEAIQLYTDKLISEPTNHTVLIGRAKAYFLNNDARNAILDLERAAKLKPYDPTIDRTRKIIEDGDIEAIKSQGSVSANTDRLQQALLAIRGGNGVQAFEEYTTLENEGYNKAYSVFNKAMACILENDIQGGSTLLNQLTVIPTTPMSVNIYLLRVMIDILGQNSSEESKRELRELLRQTPNYSYDQSAVRFLVEGFGNKEPAQYDEILAFIASIQNGEILT